MYRECVNNHRDERERREREKERAQRDRGGFPPDVPIHQAVGTGAMYRLTHPPHHLSTLLPDLTLPLHTPLPSPPLWTIRYIVSNAIPGAPLHVLSPLPPIPRTTAGYRPGSGLGNMEALRARPTDPTSVSYIGRGFFDSSSSPCARLGNRRIPSPLRLIAFQLFRFRTGSMER